jgi:hypothetical protein
MSILKKKKNFVLKSRKVAKHGAILSLIVFVLPLLAGVFVTSGSTVILLGDISVFGALSFVLSTVCLFLLQIEAWERDYI